MMKINFVAVLIATLVPMVLGFIWYHKKVFGKTWMEESGMSEEKAKGANMPLIFGLSFVFSFLLAFILQPAVIHQFAITSLFYKTPVEDVTSPEGALFKQIMDMFGHSWRTFKHGSLHGFIIGFFLVMPVFATNALFERRSFKYVAINVGYWIVALAIMGGIISCME